MKKLTGLKTQYSAHVLEHYQVKDCYRSQNMSEGHMPYTIKKQGSKWVIVKNMSGEVVGHSDSKAKAQASVRARYAGENKKK